MSILKALEKYEGWSISGEDYSSLEWFNDEISKPTEDQLNNEGLSIIAEEKLEELRLERNKLLADTDWWELPSQNITQEQTDYRQALRDITNTYTSLEDVIWPTKPGGITW